MIRDIGGQGEKSVSEKDLSFSGDTRGEWARRTRR